MTMASLWLAGVVMAAAAGATVTAKDGAGIQAAIDALPPEGGQVFLPAGTYVLKASIKARDNLTLTGAGPATVLRVCDMVVGTSAQPLKAGDRQIVLKDVRGFEVGMDVFVHKNIDWNGNTEKAFSYTITAIEGNTLKFDKAALFAQPEGATVCTGAPAILVMRRRNVVIEHLTIDGNRSKASVYVNLKMAGIYLWGAVDCTVRHCRLVDCTGDGISAQFPPSGFRPGQPMWDPAERHEGNGLVIAHNYVRGAAMFGIHIGGGQSRSVVTGNIVRECGSDGLYYCWDNTMSIVSHNIFTANRGHGIGGLGDGAGPISDTHNVTVANVCSYNGQCGIAITGGRGNVVSGNVCYGNSRSGKGAHPGIRVGAAACKTVVTGNVCDDRDAEPTCLAGRQAQTVGVEVQKGAADGVVRDNVGVVAEQRP